MSKNLTPEDWIAIKYEFENTKISMRKLAEKYKTNAMAISRCAKDEKWCKFDPIAVAKDASKDREAKAITEHRALLSAVGVRKVKEIIEELGEHYNSVDEPLIIAYAMQYQRLIKLEVEVQLEGETVMSPKSGAEYLNPKFTALQSVTSNLSKLGDKLGLSIASRKRIGIRLGKIDENTNSLFSLVDELSNDKDIIDV